MQQIIRERVEVEPAALAVRDWLIAKLDEVRREINRPLILQACKELSASGKPFREIKAGYWPQHEILRKVHEMTGLDHRELPGGDLINAIGQLQMEGLLERISHREDSVDKWRDHDCYRVAADY